MDRLAYGRMAGQTDRWSDKRTDWWSDNQLQRRVVVSIIVGRRRTRRRRRRRRIRRLAISCTSLRSFDWASPLCLQVQCDFFDNTAAHVFECPARSISGDNLLKRRNFLWHILLSLNFLMLFCSNSAHFSKIQLCVTYGQTDGRTNRWTDGGTYPLIEMRERIWKRKK